MSEYQVTTFMQSAFYTGRKKLTFGTFHPIGQIMKQNTSLINFVALSN